MTAYVDTLCKGGKHLLCPAVKPIRRHQETAQTLMGPLIVVVVKPSVNSSLGLMSTQKMLTPQKLPLQLPVARLDLA